MSKNYADYLAWSNTTETSGQDEAKCWLHYPIWLVSVDIPKSQRQIKPKRCLGWDEIHQQALDSIKATIAKDVTLACPDCTQGLRSTLTVIRYS